MQGTLLSFEQMEEGAQFAAKYGAKVYGKQYGHALKETKKGRANGSVIRDTDLQWLSYLIQP